MQLPNLPQALIAIVAVCSSAQPALTQVWPHKPVRIIVPFGPGGNTDGIARITAQRFGETFAQSFIVENRPGAGGALAAEIVARSQPDGYTLFLSAMSMLAILPAMTKTSYDPIAHFTPISNIEPTRGQDCRCASPISNVRCSRRWHATSLMGSKEMLEFCRCRISSKPAGDARMIRGPGRPLRIAIPRDVIAIWTMPGSA